LSPIARQSRHFRPSHTLCKERGERSGHQSTSDDSDQRRLLGPGLLAAAPADDPTPEFYSHRPRGGSPACSDPRMRAFENESSVASFFAAFGTNSLLVSSGRVDSSLSCVARARVFM